MLGNDIVDLIIAEKESDWRRRGYLEKIFTRFEQNLIKSSSNPDLLVWILWSMKEAVYKAHFRIARHREFAPTKIEIKNLDITKESAAAEANYYNIKYFTKTDISDSFVHSIALIDPLKFSEIKTVKLTTTSRDYTSLLINKNVINKTDNVVKTKEGIPNIATKEGILKSPISISHHGNYLAIII